jgi:4-hydroxy-3-polyprenylbenzoate decarboxylase
MMFTKYVVIVSGNVDIRNYSELSRNIFSNTDFGRDLIFCRGPLDVLDHSSDTFSFGGKLGIDATVKTPEEISKQTNMSQETFSDLTPGINNLINKKLIKAFNISLLKESIPVLIISVNRSEDNDIINKVTDALKSQQIGDQFKLVLVVDHTVDINDLFTVAWQMLGNSDPVRDHHSITESSLIFDGTVKAFSPGGFMRRWPNIVCSDNDTIYAVDQKWEFLAIGPFIQSPSLKSGRLKRNGKEEIIAR